MYKSFVGLFPRQTAADAFHGQQLSYRENSG